MARKSPKTAVVDPVQRARLHIGDCLVCEGAAFEILELLDARRPVPDATLERLCLEGREALVGALAPAGAAAAQPEPEAAPKAKAKAGNGTVDGEGRLVIERERERLPCKLSESELHDRAREMADVDRKLRDLEYAFALRRREFNTQKSELDDRRRELARIVWEKEERREVPTEHVADFRSGIVFIRRLDTGEIIAERPVRPEERQRRLPDSAFATPGEA